MKATLARLLRVCLSVACAVGAHFALAQSQPLAPSSSQSIPYKQSEPVSELNPAGTVLAILLFAAIGYGALRYAKKKGGRFALSPLRNERMKLLERLYISNRSKLYLIQVDEQILVLTETPQGSRLVTLGAVPTSKNERSETRNI